MRFQQSVAEVRITLWFIYVFINFYRMCGMHVWRSEDDFMELALSFKLNMGPRGSHSGH